MEAAGWTWRQPGWEVEAAGLEVGQPPSGRSDWVLGGVSGWDEVEEGGVKWWGGQGALPRCDGREDQPAVALLLSRQLACPALQVNTSSVVLRKLMEGREADGPLGGSADVAIRCLLAGAAWVDASSTLSTRGCMGCECLKAVLVVSGRGLVLCCLEYCAGFATHCSSPPQTIPLRLLDRGRKYAEKLAAAQREVEDAPRDAATGRPLFCPKTHRAPYYERNPEGGWSAGHAG